MTKSRKTKTHLLEQARELFWTRGYSNVSLREIAAGAGVDVALVSRYFGGKRGLFAATLETAFDWPDLFAGSPEDTVNAIVEMFTAPHATDMGATEYTMILTNGADTEVGGLVRAEFERKLHRKTVAMCGSDARAALLASVLFGYSLAQKTLQLAGIFAAEPVQKARQLRHLIDAALRFEG
jgi:AcrR family transcriptional regulator